MPCECRSRETFPEEQRVEHLDQSSRIFLVVCDKAPCGHEIKLCQSPSGIRISPIIQHVEYLEIQEDGERGFGVVTIC